MKISASVKSSFNQHQTIVQTNEAAKEMTIAVKPSGYGSSVNGGELLLLSPATRYHPEHMRKIVVLSLLLLTGCMGLKKKTGYYRLQPAMNADPAETIRNRILHSVDTGVFKPIAYTGTGMITINSRLLEPVSPDTGRKYPLVLVLHSSGRPIGTDNVSQLGVLAKLWAQPAIRKKYPAYVLVPQFPRRSSNYAPDPSRKVLASVPDSCLTTALELVDAVAKMFPIDGRRIYVVGFSMGGSGAINALGLRPGLFAAGLSISGIPDFGHLTALAKTPLWLVHGNADTENPMSSDSALYKELQALNDEHITFWEIGGLKHEIYPELYTTDAIPAWLFRQEKKD
jgi:predicted peptidase